MFREYLLQNWALILILLAFSVSLKMTVSLDQRIIRRMFVLIIGIFLLSITVFAEFNLVDPVRRKGLRTVLVAIRYSATPFILAQVIYTLIKKERWFVFVPAIILAVVNAVSVFTGIVYTVNDDGTTATITGYTGSATDVVIPSSFIDCHTHSIPCRCLYKIFCINLSTRTSIKLCTLWHSMARLI